MKGYKYFGVLPNEIIEVNCFGFFEAYILIQAKMYDKSLHPSLLEKVRDEFGEERVVKRIIEINFYNYE